MKTLLPVCLILAQSVSMAARGFAWAMGARPFDIRTLRLPVTGTTTPLRVKH